MKQVKLNYLFLVVLTLVILDSSMVQAAENNSPSSIEGRTTVTIQVVEKEEDKIAVSVIPEKGKEKDLTFSFLPQTGFKETFLYNIVGILMLGLVVVLKKQSRKKQCQLD